MATIQTRPFSRDYSGLITQSVVALCIATITLCWYEIKRRQRRPIVQAESSESVESWKYGYLYRARFWARKPSPLPPDGWLLKWILYVIKFPEEKMLELRGIDATLYCRFLRGCFWFTLAQTFTITLILLPIHLKFSDNQYSSKSMNRALISSLITTSTGLNLLWIHLFLLLWLTTTWILTLLWICRGAFQYYAKLIEECASRTRNPTTEHNCQHPYSLYELQFGDASDENQKNKGLRLRTIMVSNIPPRLRSDKELQEYFEYYMSRPIPKPSLGLSRAQPGFLNKFLSFMVNRARRIEFVREIFSHIHTHHEQNEQIGELNTNIETEVELTKKPIIQQVLMARKMTELASLSNRREEVLHKLETAHIKLAQTILRDVRVAMHNHNDQLGSTKLRAPGGPDVEANAELSRDDDGTNLLVKRLGPYVHATKLVKKFELDQKKSKDASVFHRLATALGMRGIEYNEEKVIEEKVPIFEKVPQESKRHLTIWDVLFELPRPLLNPYQPLIRLSTLFRGKNVPAIDYYTAKLGLLTSLIVENRSHLVEEFQPVSTAFVTFEDPDDARRACKYMAVHPKNPLACLVTMAPDYEDLDWIRIMKSTFRAELVKDWVVELGVWVFTISWIIPVSLLVGLVTIKNISLIIPGLETYLDRHPYLEEVISSFLPTVIVALLMLLVPMMLLVIAKKAHTLTTLSVIHDRIMTRYHKFLVANILIFFCVGVSSLQSFFMSFRTSLDILSTVGQSFPTAGPFYVGWIIFTTAMHGGLEIALFGLPLILYPFTKRQITPRKRALGIRPRTFNFYYWLPNHMLVVIVLLVFAVLNPLLIPFVLIYFMVENVVIKNQLLYVYAKTYEGNGHRMLVRIVRYSMDGLILSQVVFLALMAVLKKNAHVALTAVMITATVILKLLLTIMCRLRFEEADGLYSRIACGIQVIGHDISSPLEVPSGHHTSSDEDVRAPQYNLNSSELEMLRTWKLSGGFDFTYSPLQHQNKRSKSTRKPNPFKKVEMKKESNDDSNNDLVVDQHVPNEATAGPSSQALPGLSVFHSSRRYVLPHEKLAAWDDTSVFDRPYSNPFYTRPIKNHLWLPRDPLGVLNLDDTVDVFRSLTCDPTFGQLGEWLEEGITLFDDQSNSVKLSPPLENNQRQRPRREYSGSEEITLPYDIASRVDPALPRAWNFKNRGYSSVRQRIASINNQDNVNSVTARGETTSSDSKIPTTILSEEDIEKSRKGISETTRDPASYPELHAQARFASSQLSVVPSTTLTSIANETSTRSTNPVTMREAVVSEVIEEEHQATDSRMQQEGERLERNINRSWLTSWMYSYIPWTS